VASPAAQGGRRLLGQARVRKRGWATEAC